METKGEAWRVPKRRSTLRTDTLAFREFDYCRVWLGAHESDLIVSVPLTQPGAVFLDEEKRSAELNVLLTIAGTLADMRGSHSWPTPDALLTAEIRGHPVRDFMRRPLVALTSASDTPPPGDIGYYSDGGEHVAAVIVSASGRRLFLEADADDVVRTNVTEHLFGNGAAADRPFAPGP